jgi:hypothetical protein
MVCSLATAMHINLLVASFGTKMTGISHDGVRCGYTPENLMIRLKDRVILLLQIYFSFFIYFKKLLLNHGDLRPGFQRFNSWFVPRRMVWLLMSLRMVFGGEALEAMVRWASMSNGDHDVVEAG